MEYKVKPKEYSIIGPWLLSEETLIKIDSFMEKAFNAFKTLSGEHNGERSYFAKNKKSLTIWFNDDIEENFQSFKEAIISDFYSNQKPIKFEYVVEILSNKITITLDANDKYFGYYINCENEILKNNIYYDMQQIYTSEKPKLFFSFASLFRGYSFLLYFFIFLITAGIMSCQIDDPFKNTKEKVHQILLKEDLQKEDYLEIIRYSTIINLKFYDLAIPNNQNNLSKLFDKILLNYIIIGFIVCLIITATPKPSFAVGKGKKKVSFWKGYYKFLLKYLPFWILLPLVLNFLSYLLTRKII